MELIYTNKKENQIFAFQIVVQDTMLSQDFAVSALTDVPHVITAQLARYVNILLYCMKVFALKDALNIMQNKMECATVAKVETA